MNLNGRTTLVVCYTSCFDRSLWQNEKVIKMGGGKSLIWSGTLGSVVR